MLRIEAYPALGGLIVRVAGVGDPDLSNVEGVQPTAVTRVIPVATIEHLGVDEALRDVLVDVMVLYPGLLRYAMV
jgi:hypothetical protein